MEYKICPKCESKQAYLRKSTDDYRCGGCKHEFTLDKEVPMQTIEMTQEEAQKDWEEYKEVLKDRREKYLEDIYTCLSHMRKGKRVIDIHAVMKTFGVSEKQQPKLAIVRADAETVYFYRKDNGAGQFTRIRGRGESHKEDVWLPEKTYPEFKKDEGESSLYWSDAYKTKVPIVPPKFLPRGKLNNYYILWEVEDWELIPEDPILLKRITSNLFAVLGVWDLTPIEQAILKSR